MATPSGMDVLIAARSLKRRFAMGSAHVTALDGISFEIRRGEYVAITGPSGSGKSTLLHVLGCLDTRTEGSYQFEGADVRTLPDPELARLRNRSIGFVFQAFHLLPRTSALDNVALPLSYRSVPRAERRRLALNALEQVELSHRREHTPDSLSGGERQRVAIARALVGGPSLLLCDEPTGNLDQRAGAEITRLFERMNELLGVTVIVVTHDLSLAARAPRVLRLVDGRLVQDGPLDHV